MTPALKRMRLLNMPPVERYAYIAVALDLDGPLVEIALARIACGDVSHTQHGVRVAVNQNFDDDRSASGSLAYWPQAEAGCRCRSMKSRGECSHEVAALLYTTDIDDVLHLIEVAS